MKTNGYSLEGISGGSDSRLDSYLMTASPCEESRPNFSFKAPGYTVFNVFLRTVSMYVRAVLDF